VQDHSIPVLHCTKKMTLTKRAYISKIFCHTEFQDTTLCGASDTPILEDHNIILMVMSYV